MVNTPTFRHIFKKGSFSILFSSLVKMSSFFKVSFIIGSFTAFFSMNSVMMPLSGAFGGASGVFAIGGILFALKAFLGGFISFKFLAYHIPGIFAALYWTTRSSLLRVALPLACMAAFMVHPVGAQAWPYSLYWLVTVILYFVNKKHIFLEALGSTFIAHAVGSVIWLYASPMTPEAWLALMPVVAIERLTFASGMVIAHRVMNIAIDYATTSISAFAFFQPTKN